MSYRTYTAPELKAVAGKGGAVECVESDSGTILCSEFGGRLLGLFPDRRLHNVLWVHEDPENAFVTGSWFIGGDRLWIAPERNFYYENPRDFDGFHVPAGIDPGNYAKTGPMTFDNRFPLLDLSKNELYENTHARRSFRQIADPFASGLAYAGLSIEDSISVPSPDALFCAWSITMVYTRGAAAPGTALFPVRPGGSLIEYFDPVPAERGGVEYGYGRFRIDGANVYKIAIAPEDIVRENPVKAVYVSPFATGGTYFCVIKRGSDLPRSQEGCVDIPKKEPEGRKGAIQSYNNGPGFPGPEGCDFGEIELQMSKCVSNGAKTISRASHEVLSYAGSKQEILSLVQKALKIDAAPLLY